jgi:hypothetical protein
MRTRKITLDALIQGESKTLTMSLPTLNHAVITNKFCPPELLTGGSPTASAINGESVDDFIADCNKQLMIMSTIDKDETLLDVHIAGLIGAVMDHISRCRRLIFSDLLIYMDCFSYLLQADGFSEEKIKAIYPRAACTIADLYPDQMKDATELPPFKGGRIDTILHNITGK